MKNEYEEIARRIVSKVLDVPVVAYDLNIGTSLPDLRIDYGERSAGYVEVVSDNSTQRRSLQAAINHSRNEISIPGLEHDWWIWLRHSARLWPAQQDLPALLRKLENAGELFGQQRRSTPDLQRRIRASPFWPEVDRLGISEILAGRRAVGNAVIHLREPGTGGPAEIDIACAVEWCGRFLAHPDRKDVLRKLAETNAIERHAFVIVTLTSEWAIQHLLSDYRSGLLPDQAPDLPSEVTHLWVLGTESADRCIAWLPDRGGWIDYATGPWLR